MRHDLARLLREARGRGWTVARTGKSHWKLKHVTGAMVYTGSTPSCPRGLRNFAADLRRVEKGAPR